MDHLSAKLRIHGVDIMNIRNQKKAPVMLKEWEKTTLFEYKHSPY